MPCLDYSHDGVRGDEGVLVNCEGVVVAPTHARVREMATRTFGEAARKRLVRAPRLTSYAMKAFRSQTTAEMSAPMKVPKFSTALLVTSPVATCDGPDSRS